MCIRDSPKTGVVQWMQFVQRRRVGDRNDLRTSTLSLRAEPYVKPEAAPIPAPQGSTARTRQYPGNIKVGWSEDERVSSLLLPFRRNRLAAGRGGR